MIRKSYGVQSIEVLKSRILTAWRKLSRVAELVAPAPLDDFADYNEYWDRRGDITEVHSRWRISCANIPDGASVLDVGCGGGEFLNYLRGSRPHCRLTGIDVSEKAVRRAQARGIDAFRIDSDWPIMSKQYDYVTCLEVLEHVAHAEELLHNLMRAAGVAAIVSVPNVGFIGCRIRLGIFGRFPTTLCVFHIREHVRFWTTRDFHEWIESCGYSLSAQGAQHGIWPLYRWFPSVFASGMVYIVERKGWRDSVSRAM